MTSLRRLWDTHAPMTALGVVSGIAAVAILGVLAFDQRQILGAPVWLKPLKFMLSTAIYGITNRLAAHPAAQALPARVRSRSALRPGRSS